jgi:hypothetical protein
MYQGVVSLPDEEGKAVLEDWLPVVFLHVGQGKASEVEVCRTSRLNLGRQCASRRVATLAKGSGRALDCTFHTPLV